MRHIQEKFYSGTMTGENAFKLSECLDEHTLNTLTPPGDHVLGIRDIIVNRRSLISTRGIKL